MRTAQLHGPGGSLRYDMPRDILGLLEREIRNDQELFAEVPRILLICRLRVEWTLLARDGSVPPLRADARSRQFLRAPALQKQWLRRSGAKLGDQRRRVHRP